MKKGQKENKRLEKNKKKNKKKLTTNIYKEISENKMRDKK